MDKMTDHEVGLVEFIVQAWNKFDHAYQPPKGEPEWKCTSLNNACKQYKWGKLTREENNKKLDDLSGRLQECLVDASLNNHKLHHVCLEILEWGGVEGVSSAWFRESCENGVLREKISKGVKLLKEGPSHDDWERFDNEDLVMNSALTKVYALADPDNIPIYDGRVGAAMGLLVRRYLKQLAPRPCEVPEELAFRWGGGYTQRGSRARHPRNPSEPPYKFECLRSSKNDHEEWCWRTGRILRQVVDTINNDPGRENISMRDLDDALFMVGRIVR
ncbi:glycerol uptake facilitator and related permeases [Thiohalobacter thiocyanaticus]|uniref:Glycerol uptake facilitator and related permeases n=1 Tax=Thiohalobacter thiocyanaticus TaxID=585455 RepID=A0A1Z4VQQ4_9GAMM|nr:hypothetical protein [Thiohalobacter thiocyanaticus]BAZ93742.1 glycerol uptake facilitator and related permeases [Thiohalobacter thiocyanaticus]